MKKTNVKEVKPAYTVDITKCETLQDIKLAFAKAKQEAEQPLTNENIEAFINAALDSAEPIVCAAVVSVKIEDKKKPNIFRRFWNWLTGKK